MMAIAMAAAARQSAAVMQTDGVEDEVLSQVVDGNVPFRDNNWTDQYEFHFGEWIKQIIDWVDINLKWLLDWMIWPFRFLFDVLMNEDDGAASIMSLPWYWVAITFFLIGSTVRNLRIGVMSGVLVATCGLLGPDYWSETTKTFGMVFVSVLLCAIIGIPLGVICGRVDSVWNSVRPVLDAMQVVHSFVYMLPFIFFWGIGEPSATAATLVFALPPLVRLTNLGVRQVPSDVVEASRSFGANEFRVFKDVQLPLARPAIMTGLNQTLLMAISMLGIAAIMGAGGLGKLLLQAINSNNVPQATSSGLAYFFVAIVFDRISQRESADGLGLFGRIREAWTYRRDPQAMLDLQAERDAAPIAAVDQHAAIDAVERGAAMGPVERLGLMVGAAALSIAAISTFLTWSSDAGLVASWSRRNDEVGLIGKSFIGIEASGGSLFAVILLGLALVGVMCGLRPLFEMSRERLPLILNQVQGMLITALLALGVSAWLFNIFDGDFSGWLDGTAGSYNRVWTVIILVVALAIGEFMGQRLTARVGFFTAAFGAAALIAIAVGAENLSNVGLIVAATMALTLVVETFVRGTPRLGADGMLISALGAFGVALGYFLLRAPSSVTQHSHGIGVWIALACTAVAVLAGLVALFAAPYTSRVPLKLSVRWPAVVGALIAILALLASLIAPWAVDARLDTLMTPELETEIQRLRDEAGDDINKQIANGQAITNLINGAQADPISFNGVDSEGPGLGVPTLAFAAAAAITALLAAGLFGGDETHRWRFGSITAGLGLAAMVIPAGWIFSLARTSEPRAVSGNGSFFAMCVTFILFATGRSIISTFRRRKVYGDAAASGATPIVDVTQATEPLVDATANE